MKKYLLAVATILLSISLCSSKTIDTNKQTLIKYNQELDGYQYPFEVKTFLFNSQNQDLKMRYMDVGEKDSKNVIVLLHGKNFSGYYWDKIARDLVKRGYRVIIPDQIGFGKSTKPKSYQYSFRQFALNTKLLMNSLNIVKFDVVGHSMGGMLGVTLAVDYVKSVSKLILINPIGLEDYSKYVQFKDVNFFYKGQLNTTVAKAINYQKKNYYDGKWSQKYEKLLTPLKGMLASKDWPIVAWNNALTYGPIFSENIVDKLSQIECKTHLIIGTRDTTGPGRAWLKEGVRRKLGQYKKLAKLTHRRIKRSTLIELEGLGHMPQYENYDVFIKAFDQSLKN